MRISIIFDNFGPYHYARLQACAQHNELSAIQIHAKSSEYAWKNEKRETDFKLVTLFPEGTSRDAPPRELYRKISQALEDHRPEVVFIPGWSSRAALAALLWCRRHHIPAVCMSESTEWDEQRVAWKEWIKRKILGSFSTALVGGRPHADYLVQLGFPAEKIFLGYDAVDNDYFATKALEAVGKKSELQKQFGLPEKYFLASARFIEKKNLCRLLEAYARYCDKIKKTKETPWHLVLLGDGPLRATLESQITSLELQGQIILPCFKQYPDLPTYYALAGAFIHASTVEQWGLVVNEAMASGLPVLVSNRSGCASELVREGENGFTFGPCDIEKLADLMRLISCLDREARLRMGAESRRIISQWSPRRFADGVADAASRAVKAPAYGTSALDRFLLHMLMLK